MKKKIILLLFAANILSGQERSYLFPVFSLASNYFEIPSFGLGHYLKKDYSTGSFFSITEGAGLYFSSKKTTWQFDTTKYPNISNESIVYKKGLRGISAEAYSRYYLNYFIRANTLMIKDIDHFLAFRKFWKEEDHRQYVSQSSFLNLAASPFQAKYLKEPAVFLPILIAASVPFWETTNNKSIFDTKSINIFGKDFSTFEGGSLKILSDFFLFSLVAISEEMLFRGMLQTSLSEAVTPNFGLVASSILFGLAHMKNHDLIYTLRAAVTGMYLGWQYQKYNNDLGRVIALHFHIDFMPTLIDFFKNPNQANGVYSVGY